MLIFSLEISAQDYSTGYGKYAAGDFLGSEAAFQAALFREGISDFEKSRIYKMLGISQYMQGKRLESENSFKLAKSYNSKAAIAPSEVLDESVIEFFNTVIPQQRTPAPSSTSSVASRKQTEPAFLKVLVNVRADVVIDGKIVTKSGVSTELPAGIHEVEITAQGFKKYTQPVQVESGKVNLLNIALEKLPTVDLPQASPKGSSGPEVPAMVNRDDTKRSKNLPPPMVHTAKKKTKKSSTSKISSKRAEPTGEQVPLSIMHFMPLGAGQFVNQSFILGSVVLAGQFAATYLFIDKWNRSNALVEEHNTVIDRRTLEEATLPTDEERAVFHQETEQYHTKQYKQIDALQQEAFMSLSVGLVFWIGGMIEAIIDRPYVAPSPIKSLSTEEAYKPKLHLGLVPQRMFLYDPPPETRENTVATWYLKLNYEF